MEEIIEALLDIEQKAETALNAVKWEKEKLPARIKAETEHVRKLISQETAVVIGELRKESERSTAARIQAIHDDSAKQFTDLEYYFTTYRKELHSHFFRKLTQWTM